MTFVWRDKSASHRSYPMGYKVVGLQQNNLRPSYIELDWKDLDDLLKTVEHIEMYLGRLRDALARPH